MGGMGSGLATRSNKKTVIEEVRRIDIRFMKKMGFLKPNVWGTLNWTRGDQPNGEINFTNHEDCLELRYRISDNNREWKDINQNVLYSRSACHYGSYRQWFLCPKCGSRVAVLALNGRSFECRHCHKFPYRSQQEGAIDRLVTKKHKLGERIFKSYEYGDGWGKNKGMHQKTFDSLYAQYIELEEQWNMVFDKYIYLV